jgi:hypothetical protein
MLMACSKEENNCSSCHIVIYQESNAYYLTDLEEICNEELINAQNEGFYIYDTIFNDYLNNPLPMPIFPNDTLSYHCGNNHSH